MRSFKSLPTIALALTVGIAAAVFAASPADAQQAKAKATKAAAAPQARSKMCSDRYKGQYRSQQDGWLFQHGYCLSNIVGWR
jgi:hypothetical protein